MGGPVFFYSPLFERYDFGPHHPLRPERLLRTRSLLLEKGLLLAGEEREPEPAREEDLLLVHTPEYIRAVKAEKSDPLRGLGTGDNPVFPGMHEAGLLVVGASVQAALLAVEGKASLACNLSGGLHHALPDRASGFCVYNDPAVAIARVKRDYGLRVAYLDVDAHHGDGVQAVFYEDPAVLTVSLHQSGRYLFPGTGFPEELGRGRGRGYALNLPLLPGTRDDSFLECLEMALQAVEAFRPDLLVLQAGVDGHRRDPLAHLEYTTRGYRRAVELIRRLVRELLGDRWVVLGGGGYDWEDAVPRSWAVIWAAAAGRPVPPEIEDQEGEATPEEVARENRRVASEAVRACLQIIRS